MAIADDIRIKQTFDPTGENGGYRCEKLPGEGDSGPARFNWKIGQGIPLEEIPEEPVKGLVGWHQFIGTQPVMTKAADKLASLNYQWRGTCGPKAKFADNYRFPDQPVIPKTSFQEMKDQMLGRWKAPKEVSVTLNISVANVDAFHRDQAEINEKCQRLVEHHFKRRASLKPFGNPCSASLSR